MIVIKKTLTASLLIIAFISCKQSSENKKSEENMHYKEKNYMSYQEEIDFMSLHTNVIELVSASGNEKVAIAPGLQGRVMTSTANGGNGRSYGWINRERFSAADTLPHINVYGGEERFWLGPEGGQYSIFFKKDDAFNLDNWYTPRLIDLEPFEVNERSSTKVSFSKEASLTNYSGFTFDMGIHRKVALLSNTQLTESLGVKIPEELKSIAYQTTNSLTNLSEVDWQKETGLLSIWLLGMYNASPSTTVIVPFHPGDEANLGKVVTDDYFGKVPAERLVVKDSVLYFSGDANYRSKIGLSPQRAKTMLGSYDEKNGILTIVKYNKPEGVTDYVNSLWEIQDEPYKGDVVNSYNDGPPAPGEAQLGQFYELETSSPALALKVGESSTHTQLTCHFEGDKQTLDVLAKQILGISLYDIGTNY